MLKIHDHILQTITEVYPYMKIRKSRLEESRTYDLRPVVNRVGYLSTRDKTWWFHLVYDYTWLDEGTELSQGEMSINIGSLTFINPKTIKEVIDPKLERELRRGVQ